jgi:hypothetical protein
MSLSKWIAVVSFSVCALNGAAAQAVCTDCMRSVTSGTLDNREKIYLTPGSLSMDASHLYVNFGDRSYPVQQVLTDERGVYIDARELENSKYGIWICPNGHPNPPWNLVCSVCNK